MQFKYTNNSKWIWERRRCTMHIVMSIRWLNKQTNNRKKQGKQRDNFGFIFWAHRKNLTTVQVCVWMVHKIKSTSKFFIFLQNLCIQWCHTVCHIIQAGFRLFLPNFSSFFSLLLLLFTQKEVSLKEDVIESKYIMFCCRCYCSINDDFIMHCVVQRIFMYVL